MFVLMCIGQNDNLPECKSNWFFVRCFTYYVLLVDIEGESRNLEIERPDAYAPKSTFIEFIVVVIVIFAMLV